MIRALEYLSCEKRLTEVGSFILESRRFQGEFAVAFQYRKGAYKEDGMGLFTKAFTDRTKGNGFKLKELDLVWAYGNNSL